MRMPVIASNVRKVVHTQQTGTAAAADAAHSTPVVGDLQLRRTRPRQAHAASFDILPTQATPLRRPDFGHKIARATTSPLPVMTETDRETFAAAPTSPMWSTGSSYGDSYWDDDREADTRRTSLLSSATIEVDETHVNQHGVFTTETRECAGPQFLQRRRSSGWSRIVDWCDEQLDVIATSKRRRSISPMMISAPRPSLSASLMSNSSDPFAADSTSR